MTDLVSELVASYSQGNQDETQQALVQAANSSSLNFINTLSAVFHAFSLRQDAATGANFVLSSVAAFPPPENYYLILVQELGETSPEWLRANLFLMYLNNGGTSVEVFEKILYYLSTNDEAESIIRVYRMAIAAGLQTQLMEMTLFNVATTMIGQGLYQEAFEIYAALLPTSPEPGSIMQNIFALARVHMVPDAINFVAKSTNDMLDGYSTKRSAAPESVELDYHGEADDAALVNTVLSKGFCVVRQGCKLDVVERAHRYVSSELQAGFPADFDDQTIALVSELFRFDTKRVVRDILKYSSEMDLMRCVIRRVRAGTASTFTPFHQDVAAFFKAVLNIWVPLTPAGGEYPTIDFIKKRIGRAEQTKITDGEYNLVEIEEAYVMEKYGELLYTLENASPGDCVIFLGSTIHRSSNLAQATKDRFNLEVRFS